MNTNITRTAGEVLALLWSVVYCDGAGAPLWVRHPPPDESSFLAPASASDINQVLSPSALLVSHCGTRLYLACASANLMLVVDAASGRITQQVTVPESPVGLALAPDDGRLYVACSDAPFSTICVIDTAQGKIVGRLVAGHTAMAPVLSPDGTRLYVCNRFENNVSILDLASGEELARVPVEREPVAADLTSDGHLLIVANHLYNGPANTHRAAAVVSVIDTQAMRLIKTVRLPEGASLLRGVAISPDDRFAAVTHLKAVYWLTTTAVEMGGINANAVSIIDLNRLEWLGTVLLDQTTSGAANPWAVEWLPDGRTIVVTHAGTGDLSLINAPVEADRSAFFNFSWSTVGRRDSAKRERGMHPPPPPVRVRQRISLPGDGPRALAVAGAVIFVGQWYSDSVCRIDLAADPPTIESLLLSSSPRIDKVRQGEQLFNDARLCAQGWQSCASCHDIDGRTDALNWDLLNDGAGNAKNTKTLVWSHRTPPVMALGVRANAEAAVRAGIHHILFTDQTEPVAQAIDEYLKSLRPLPSPYRVNGQLSEAARRGEALFMSLRTGCVNCHPPPYFTDQGAHDVGTAGMCGSLWGNSKPDEPSQPFDTPALVELWRTAPYLHDGSAAALLDVLTTKNLHDLHGQTSDLSRAEVEDLIAYLLVL